MSLFDDVVVNAKTAANAVGKKAGQIMDVSKLRISAADLHNEIGKRFETLGRVVYDARKAGRDAEDVIAENTAAIDELYEQMDAVNEQLRQLQNKTVCKACGQEIPQDSVFCNHCGAKIGE